MSQQKAASLTSSLLARKGRAAPAGLLTTGLDGATGQGSSDNPPLDLYETHDGESMKLSALKLNGPTGANKPEGPDAQLPLLAFVEAQLTSDQADTVSKATEETPAGESIPAASLLGRGARTLRGDKASRPSGEPGSTGPEALAQESEVIEASVVELCAEPDIGCGMEIVPGVSSVTAIIDAPAEEPENGGPLEVEEVAAAPEARLPQPPTAVNSAGEAPVAVPPAPSAELKAATDAAISATLAMRRAAASRSKPAAADRAAKARTVSAPPAAESRLPWRSAAVVGLGVALGLVGYATLSTPPQQTPIDAAPPVMEAPPQTATGLAATAAIAEAKEQTAESLPAPAGTPAAPLETAAGTDPRSPGAPEPSFDIIRIEPDGHSIIAGRAAPFSEWILLNNDSPIASITADANGEWVVLPDASLVPGANAFSLVPKTERGKVAIPAPEPISGPRETDPGSAPGAALSPAEAEMEGKTDTAALGGRLALPKPKPQNTVLASVPLPVFRVAAEGEYQVQLASVRQSIDAERELTRLATAFPMLLGELELRIQEASVEGAGTFFRVRSGAIVHLGEARELCRRLEGEGQGCLVVRRLLAAPAPQTKVVTEAVETLVPAQQQAERQR